MDDIAIIRAIHERMPSIEPVRAIQAAHVIAGLTWEQIQERIELIHEDIESDETIPDNQRAEAHRYNNRIAQCARAGIESVN